MYGYDRGTPIDRHYNEEFFARCRNDIRGHVLDSDGGASAAKFGSGAVSEIQTLHGEPADVELSTVPDLARMSEINTDSLDCVLLNQVLQFASDLNTAIGEIYRILKPTGVLLATFPGTVRGKNLERGYSPLGFTTRSARLLMEKRFRPDCISVESFGNILTATSCLYGLAAEELSEEELSFLDPHYPLLVAARAVK
jgi:SAM-dependent methyltransferase